MVVVFSCFDRLRGRQRGSDSGGGVNCWVNGSGSGDENIGVDV